MPKPRKAVARNELRRGGYSEYVVRAGRKGTGKVLARAWPGPMLKDLLTDQLIATAQKITCETGYHVRIADTIFREGDRVTCPFYGYEGEILWASVLSLQEYGEW